MALFEHHSINFDVLRERAFNYRWAEVPEGVIPLTAADSDFPMAPELVEGLTRAIAAGYMPYTPKLGYTEVRKSIARQLNERKHEGVEPELLLPIDSAARGMYVIAKAVLEAGDEAIIFDPVDYLFTRSVESAGAKPVLFPAKVGANNRIDLSGLEGYITPKTRMIGLCNPHNPLGTIYSGEELRLILHLAEKYDLYIMNDEIWSDIVYPQSAFLSILTAEPALNRRVLSVYGFSKSFSIAGLRAGCVYVSTKEMFDRIVDCSDVMSTAGGIAGLSQLAAQICMDKCYYWNEAFVACMKENRDYAIGRIARMPGIVSNRPDALFMLFPDITGTGLDSRRVAAFLEQEEKLAVVPGTAQFFGPGAEGHIRICLATSREVLAEGMNRLERGMNKLAAKRA